MTYDNDQRKNPARRFALCLAAAVLIVGTTELSAQTTVAELSSTLDLYYPGQMDTSLPVVFLAHNGGAKKEDWGNFAEDLADSGYIVASIGWTAFSPDKDLQEAIDAVFKRFGAKASQEKVAFIGGCHGAVKFTRLLREEKYASQVKALVFLSISEDIIMDENHAPVLAAHSLQDHLGTYYIDKTKAICEKSITEPKKVIALDSNAHGNEMVMSEGSREIIRPEIKAWLKQYL
jgi:hypothetical protein